jgi:hypothetical protein
MARTKIQDPKRNSKNPKGNPDSYRDQINEKSKILTEHPFQLGSFDLYSWFLFGSCFLVLAFLFLWTSND